MSPTKKELKAVKALFSAPPSMSFVPEPYWGMYDSSKLSTMFNHFLNQCRKRKLTRFAEIGSIVDHLESKGVEVDLDGVKCLVIPKVTLDSLREEGMSHDA